MTRGPAFLASFFLLLILPLLSCVTAGPDYVRPESPVPDAWHAAPDPALVPDAAMVREWWTLLGDPVLTELIEEAADENLGLKVAVARVDEARARLRMALGGRWPQVGAEGAVVRSEGGESGLLPPYLETIHSAGVGAAWELDLFGRVRRSVEAASAGYEASAEDRTDVALIYLDVRTMQARLEAAESNIASQRKILALTRARFTHGLATDLEVAQAERVLASSEVEVPLLRIALERGINTLAVLLGQTPGSLHARLAEPAPIPVPPAKVTVGLPVDLLRQRPDIRRAERRLAAQTARVGLATAELYPKLTLTGRFGYEALSSSDLFDAGSRVFSLGPALRWNVFAGGRLRAQIAAEDARATQALLGYEQTVLGALNEVENALIAYVEQRVRFEALERAVAASQRSLELATRLYKEGLVGFQDVLDAQRAVFAFENQLAAARGVSAASFVQLYRALGGGWDPAAPRPGGSPPAEAHAGARPPSAPVRETGTTSPR